MVYPAYDVPLVGYTCISALFRFRAVQHLNLSVIDNTFDATKADALYSVIQNSGLRSFSFMNSCGDYDMYRREYSDFDKNMRKFKGLPMTSEIRWMNKIVR